MRAGAAQRDTVLRSAAGIPDAYPHPPSAAVTAGTIIGTAVAAFANSEAGRAAIEHAVTTAGSMLRGILGRIE